MSERLQIEREIEAGIERMQRQLGIAHPSRAGRYVLIGCVAAALLAAIAYAPRAKADEITCDWEKGFATLAADKRFGKPVTAAGPTAMQLAAIANLNPTKQAMLVPMFGKTPDELKFVVLVCGPHDSWAARHFTIDVEAERKFYNLAPPTPVEISEDDLKPVRTRRPKQ
jgi:hypothetical protein